MNAVTTDRAITDEASAQRWHARCQEWIKPYAESVQRLWTAEDAVRQRAAKEDDTQGAMLKEMAAAGLDSADIEHVMYLAQEAARDTYRPPEA